MWSHRPVLETGNIIIEIGNGIILAPYRLLIKKLLLQNNFYLTRGAQNYFKKQEIE